MKTNQTFSDNKAILYVIATPIGNLSEVSQRMIDAINDSSCVFCEDTRVSGNLLNHLGIHKPLYSAYENIEKSAACKAIEILLEGNNVALMSDAGYPAISDPGNIIIQEAIKNDIHVAIINGPSALIHSLVASGFDTSSFFFYGFLNPKEEARKKELESLKNLKTVLIFYQSPHKISACLKNMLEILGDRQVCLCRELTKKFEEYIRGTISELIPLCETYKGEMVLIVDKENEERVSINESMIDEIDQLIKNGLSKKEAIKTIALKYEISKSELYNFYHSKGE